MKVLKVTASGVSIPTPKVSRVHNCFCFSHGPAGEATVSEYRLHLRRQDFRIANDYDWPRVNYQMAHLIEREYDHLGNRIYQLVRSESVSGDCICLLDICPYGGGMATFFSCNSQVTVLGNGIGRRASPFRSGGARRATEVEYPVLLCQPGAHFTWINHGLLFGSPPDCQATWDGNLLRVAPQPLMPALAERLEQRLYA